MENANKENFIQIVIEKIKNEYKNLYITYDYLDYSNVYEIWYDKKELKNDKKFQDFIGFLIKNYLFSNKIYNIYFDYNEEKVESLRATLKYHANYNNNIGIKNTFSNFSKNYINADFKNQNIISEEYKTESKIKFDTQETSETNSLALAA